MTFDSKIKELDISLPDAKDPVGAYVATKITGNLIRNWGENRQLFDGKKIKSIQETFKNIKEIILKDNKKIFQNKFSFFNKNVVTNEKNIMFLQSLPRLWLELFSIVGVLMLFLTNIYHLDIYLHKFCCLLNIL